MADDVQRNQIYILTFSLVFFIENCIGTLLKHKVNEGHLHQNMKIAITKCCRGKRNLTE